MASNYKPLGSTGLTRFGGHIYEEWLNSLKGTKGVRTYKEMRDNDSIIGAFLFAVEMLIRQVDYRIESQGDTDIDEQAKDFIDDCLQDIDQTWSEIISSILTMLPFGWSLLEVTLKKRADGRVGWRSWSHRAQETLYQWHFDEENVVTDFEQIAPPSYKIVKIPMDKCLLFRLYSNKESPEGRSILRSAYRPWYFKKNIETIEGIGIERDLAGLPVVKIPGEIIQEDGTTYADYKKMVSNIRRDEQEGIILPSDRDENGNLYYELELLSTGSKRQFDTNQIITRYDQRIAMTVLADFLMLGHGERGSFALSSDKTDLFAVALGAILESIADVLNKEAIPKLIKINGFNIEKPPLFKFEDIETPDLNILGSYIKNLSGAGFELFPNEELEETLMETANLPPRKRTKETDVESEQLEVQDDELKKRFDLEECNNYYKEVLEKLDSYFKE